MKPVSASFCTALWLLSIASALAQVQTAATSTDSTSVQTNSAWQATPLDDLRTEHKISVLGTDATGATVTNTHRYFSVGSGANYLSDSGWQPAKDLIEIQADGSAAALRCGMKVYFSPDLNGGGITVVTRSNRVYKTVPLGLFFFDAASGETARISPLQSCTAELHPPNVIVYKSAFSCGDLRVTVTKAGLEVDVIWTARPKAPSSYSPTLNAATCRLEVWHGFSGDLHDPKRTVRVLSSNPAATAEPELVEEILDFGDAWFPQGRAFPAGSSTTDSNTPAQIYVPSPATDTGLMTAKRWTMIDQSPVLLESVPWPDISPQLASLPEVAMTAKPAKGLLAQQKTPSSKDQGRRFAARHLPPSVPARKHSVARVQLASAPYRPKGYVWDYITVSGSGDFTFDSSTTYLVDGTIYTYGTVTFQPSCVVKVAADMIMYGNIVCNGDNTSYSIITSTNDDLYGDQISGSNHLPGYDYPHGIDLYYEGASLTFAGLKIRYAQTGLELDSAGDCETYTQTVTNCAFEVCQTAISANNCSVQIASSTQCAVGTSTTTSYSDCTAFSGSLTDVCASDADGNGLPDWWEFTYFGGRGTDPYGDPDGDGLNNLQEYALGTNPRVSNNVVAPTAIGLELFTPLK